MHPELKLLLSGIVIAFYGLFMTALIVKYREVRRASFWIAAQARIIASRSEARKITKRISSGRSSVQDIEIRNFAVIRYAFNVDGRRIEAGRISMSDDPGNFQVAEKLKRYPVGKTVTVFHDRSHPENCVLERDMSGRSFEIAILAGSLVGVCGLLAVFASSGMLTLLTDFMGPLNPGCIFLAVMGLSAAAFGYALRQRGAATYRWPQVAGKIVSSSVDALQTPDPTYRGRARTLFRAHTVYTYSVDGVIYKSDRTSLGSRSYASFRILVRRTAAQFTAGQAVEVFYNPAAPAQAVLTRGAPGQFLVWLVAFAFLSGAVYLGGLVQS